MARISIPRLMLFAMLDAMCVDVGEDVDDDGDDTGAHVDDDGDDNVHVNDTRCQKCQRQVPGSTGRAQEDESRKSASSFVHLVHLTDCTYHAVSMLFLSPEHWSLQKCSPGDT